jgi:hypothetical protein
MDKDDAEALKIALRSLNTARCNKAAMITASGKDKRDSGCTLQGLFHAVKTRSPKYHACSDLFGYFRDSSLNINIKALETHVGDILHALEAREVYRADIAVSMSAPLTFRMDSEEEKKAFGVNRGTGC